MKLKNERFANINMNNSGSLIKVEKDPEDETTTTDNEQSKRQEDAISYFDSEAFKLMTALNQGIEHLRDINSIGIFCNIERTIDLYCTSC